jgi:vacuolar-type H+-ATPase subunit E/Vma4
METTDNRIKDRILKDAREEARTIVKNAQTYAETLLEKQRLSAQQNADKEATLLLKKAENEANIIGEKVYTDVKRQAGWTVLSEKNRLVTNVLDEVKSRLLGMQKNSDYCKVLERLIVDACTVLGGGALEILLNENDSQLSFRFSNLEKEISDKTGVNTQLTVSDQHITAVGVIVKTVDDRIFVDNTFEAILRRREKELRLKTAKILFSGAAAS